MNIIWAYDIQNFQSGNSLGYYYAQQGQRKALEKLGVTFELKGKFAFHHIPPHMYYPLPGAFNYVYTMYEAYDLPRGYRDRLAKCDRFGVPSQFTKEIFQRAGLTQPIDVIPHGIDSELFEFKKRDSRQNLRFLWVGAPNYRKGVDLVCKAFEKVFTPNDPVELYIKSTIDQAAGNVKMFVHNFDKVSKEYLGSGLDAIDGYEMIPYPKIKIDCKQKSVEELVKIYQDAHCFVFPSRGEGFGLTAAEAMATGAFIITSNKGGQREFCTEENSYLVPTKKKWDVNYGIARHRCYVPEVDELAKAMAWVFNNWEKAERKAKKGADNIRENFTWDKTGKKLYDAFKECGCQ